MGLLAAAVTRTELADLVAGFFSDPVAAWSLLSSPEATARVVASTDAH